MNQLRSKVDYNKMRVTHPSVLDRLHKSTAMAVWEEFVTELVLSPEEKGTIWIIKQTMEDSEVDAALNCIEVRLDINKAMSMDMRVVEQHTWEYTPTREVAKSAVQELKDRFKKWIGRRHA